MRTTTQTFKRIMASGGARKYLVKIDLTLADNTVLHLTEADIWDNTFKIETASSGTSSFDIGSAVIGKCSFSINNFDERFNQYDFFNATATVWIKLVGDTQYYRMGFFTVDEPTYANALISLVLLDNMWKFDVPLSEVNITFPTTAQSAINSICSYCGVILNTQQFHGYNFTISEAPKDDMNCREFLQYVAMIGCNFCVIDDTGALNLKWYQQTDVANFSRNFNTSIGTDEITITGVKFVIDNTEHRIGTDGYVLELSNPLVNESNVNSVLNLIWDVLEGFTLRTFNATTISDLSVEVGDKCKVTDYKGNEYYSWVTFNSFGLSNHMVQCNAIPPQRTLVKRYSKTVQAAVEEARREASQVISNYDLAVQMMNNLAVNAMGGYEEYEDLPTGGRVWYLSNRPITKNPTTGVCTFESGSTVYKKSGDGFFVSRDGGTTWVNGYNMSTGELVVNVLDAIGINFDWARGGTLTLGGYGNGNGVLSIQDATNVEKVHGDNTGLKVGSTVGSRIHINTSGEMEYDYNNTYSGKIRMRAKNYGTEQSPDIRDTFAIEDFNTINLNADDYATIDVRHNTSGSSQTGEVHLEASDGNTQSSYVDIQPDGIYLYGDLHPASNTSGLFTNLVYAGSDGYLYDASFDMGILYSSERSQDAFNTFGSRWHRWSSGTPDVYIASIVLGVGVTQAVFPETDSNLSYEPFIQCADGVEPPLLEGISFSSGSCTVRFTAVTAAQAGSGGSSCVIKLREFF